MLLDDKGNDASTKSRRWLPHEDSAPEHPHPPFAPPAETGAESFGAPAAHRPRRRRPPCAGRVPGLRRVSGLGRGRHRPQDRYRHAPGHRARGGCGAAAARCGRGGHLPAQPADAAATASHGCDRVPGHARARALDDRYELGRTPRRPRGRVRAHRPRRARRADWRLDPGRPRRACRRRPGDGRLSGSGDARVRASRCPCRGGRNAAVRGGRAALSRTPRDAAGAPRGAHT